MAAFDFPASPSVGQIYRPGGGRVDYQWDGTDWRLHTYPGGLPTSGFRNVLINGEFNFWGRASPLAAGTGLRFGPDRWYAYSIGSTVAINVQAMTIGAANQPYPEPVYCMVVSIVSVAGSGNLAEFGQRIENVRTLAGQKAMLSFWMYSDAVRGLAIGGLQNFGTGGAPSASAGWAAIPFSAPGPVWTKYVIPVTVPSIYGKTIGTNGDDFLQLDFYLDAGASIGLPGVGQTNGTYYVSNVQLEAGEVATDFERRPFTLEYLLCQRYYETGYHNCCFAVPSSGGFGQTFTIPFKANKRAVPTIGHTYGGQGNIQGLTPIGSGETGCTFIQGVGSVQTNSTFNTYWTASSEL